MTTSKHAKSAEEYEQPCVFENLGWPVVVDILLYTRLVPIRSPYQKTLLTCTDSARYSKSGKHRWAYPIIERRLPENVELHNYNEERAAESFNQIRDRDINKNNSVFAEGDPIPLRQKRIRLWMMLKLRLVCKR